MKLKIILLILVVLAICSSVLTGLFYFRSAREMAISEAHNAADLHIAIITGQINSLLAERQKVLKSLTGLDEIQRAISLSGAKQINDANQMLQYYQESLGIQVLYLMRPDGVTIAASNHAQTNSFVGKNYGFRSYFSRAMEGYPSSYFALGVTTNQRGIYLGQPVRDNEGKPAGVLVAKERIFFIKNALAKTHNGIAVLSSPDGVVFVSSQPEWLYQSLWQLSAEKQNELIQSRTFGDKPIDWLGLTEITEEQAVDRQGREFIVHRSDVENIPGWQIIFFHDKAKLYQSIKLPLFRSVGVTVTVLCILVIMAAILLLRVAQKDIQQKRHAEQRLRRAREHFQKVFEFASDAFFILRENGEILDANHHACEKLGFTKEELIKLNILAIELGSFETEDTNLSQRLGDEKSILQEGLYRRKDGTTFPVEISMGLFHEDHPRLFAAIARDTSERKAIEEERDLLNKQLNEKNKEMEQIVYVTSHDLRSPLVSIEGFSGIMNNSVTELLEILNQEELTDSTKDKITPLADDCREAAKFINKGITSMASLLSGMLQFSRLGRIELVREELEMNNLMSDLIDSFKTQINAQNATIDLGTLPPCSGDRAQIHQLFSNLIGNALKYAHPDRPLKITISGQRDGQKSVYCVEDNGIGIAPEFLEKVFEMFHQLDAKAGGEGLGLSVVAKITERHGGKVSVEPGCSGEGCCFCVTL